MRRVGSYIAGEIMRDIRLEEAYKKRQRANCKEKKCCECHYAAICSINNNGEEGEERWQIK